MAMVAQYSKQGATVSPMRGIATFTHNLQGFYPTHGKGRTIAPADNEKNRK
jgi:hypothetical protein